MKLKIDDKVLSPLGLFTIINIHNPFSGLVDIFEPLLLIYDNMVDMEMYISYKEYKQFKYDSLKNITIIEKGFFKRKLNLTEEHERYDIKNVETGEVIECCYLDNNSWTYIKE